MADLTGGGKRSLSGRGKVSDRADGRAVEERDSPDDANEGSNDLCRSEASQQRVQSYRGRTRRTDGVRLEGSSICPLDEVAERVGRLFALFGRSGEKTLQKDGCR